MRAIWILCLVLVSSVLPVYSCSSQQFTEGKSLAFAQNYLINAPTYKFDGVNQSVQVVNSKTIGQNGWEFSFTFSCSHAGYGDRTGQVLAQVITTHSARIQVVNGKVTSAILDDKWDEFNQKML